MVILKSSVLMPPPILRLGTKSKLALLEAQNSNIFFILKTQSMVKKLLHLFKLFEMLKFNYINICL